MTRRAHLPLPVTLGLFLVLFVSCVAPVTSDASQPTFDPVRAFAGRSHGNGILSVIFQAPQPFHVESRGFTQSNDVFRLNQTVTFEGKTSEQRHWLLKKISPTSYAGTLSDAEGPVEGHIEGSQLRLVYALPGNLTMHQTLTLEPGGRMIDNVGRIMFLGIQIGYLHETIERKKAVRREVKRIPTLSSSGLATK